MGSIPIYREAMALNKKLGRLLRPNMGVYFLLLLGFVAATALLQEYVLAGVELAVLALCTTVYLLHRAARRKDRGWYPSFPRSAPAAGHAFPAARRRSCRRTWKS